jgi:starch synthase
MNSGEIVLVHPTANQNVRETARALAEAELLHEFWTCVRWKRGGFFDRLLKSKPRAQAELRRRCFNKEIDPFVRTFGWREWGRQLSGRLGLPSLGREEAGVFSMDAVYHSLGRRVAGRLRDDPVVAAVYAYDAGALEVFRAAKKRGLTCIYEHPIIYWRTVREIQREEAERQPQWAGTLLALRDSAEKLARKDEELALADVVVVACTFARQSLGSAPTLKAPVRVLPYGAPESVMVPSPPAARPGLRILFVGALTQAKGLSYLFEAVEKLGPSVTLTLVGRRVSAEMPPPALLDRYRWIPSLSHDRLLEEMASHDVLVLPSLHEGFGLVILEAMAQGTPVITTSHTGGADVIEDGLDGFIVPIRSADAIVEKIELLRGNAEFLHATSEAARAKAKSCAWSIYRERVIALARDVMAH